MKYQPKWSDLIYVLALPIYLVIGTMRHELSHAAVAKYHGWTIEEMWFLPARDFSYWGYVLFDQMPGRMSHWHVNFAPYIFDLITFGFFFLLCFSVSIKRRWIWMNVVIIGLISPLVNSAFNYCHYLVIGASDIDFLMKHTISGSCLIHSYFIATIILYLFGIWSVIKLHKMDSDSVAVSDDAGLPADQNMDKVIFNQLPECSESDQIKLDQ